MIKYNTFVTDNKLKVVSQKEDTFKSLSIGVWVKIGSMYETKETNGISHFIEHMLFKGTKKYSSKEISNIIERTGGEINAFTSREFTCFYVKTLSENLDEALSILSDMIINPLFKEDEIEKERSIILEERLLYEDAPDEVVYDNLIELMYGKKSTIANQVIGTVQSIENIDKRKILEHFSKYYIASNCIVSVCSNLEDNFVFDKVSQYFSKINQGRENIKNLDELSENWGAISEKKKIEQVQIEMGFKGYGYNSDYSYGVMLLNNLLCGSNDSRLFYKLREEHGITYSIQSSPIFYDGSGFLSINLAVNKSNVKKALDLILEELKIIKEKGFTDSEISDSKQQLIGNTILGMESTDSIMDFIARIHLHDSDEKCVEDLIFKIESVTRDELNEISNDIFENFNLSIVGNIKEKEVKKMYNEYKEYLK